MEEDFTGLETEAVNPRTADLDRLSGLELASRLHAENYGVAEAVASALPLIALVIEESARRLRKGGRLLYVGAGTSGRLAVLDASECPPTFGVSRELVVALIAGGEQAVTHSIEGAEDDAGSGARDIGRLAVGHRDVVVGIAASGRTPYVIGALDAARAAGAYTAALANVSRPELAGHADVNISIVTGAEPVTGSTRMKAGTAQKMALNLISTGVMVRLGKTYGNLMVDVMATNLKLRDRATRIVMQATGFRRGKAEELLIGAEGSAKAAIVMGLLRLNKQEAEQRLASCQGSVGKALESETTGIERDRGKQRRP
ncbi:MAG TPA: N-acetylmuramic acid 6-phosphate etherase [Chthonomonadales bacterium]|nr:N-acetylmuramic acid 6-phosphate etherase [Chthonomonadales bacterium]